MRAGGRPNLLLFMPDQLRADCVGALGNSVVQTPHIDALAARGTVFTQAFSQHSVCGPSRVSMFTGWYPHVAGHRSLDNLIKPWEPNLLRMLRESGYHVVWLGRRGDTFAPGVVEDSTDFYGFTVQPGRRWVGPGLSPDDPFFTRYYWFFTRYYWGRRPDGLGPDHDEAAVASTEEWLASSPPEPWVCFLALIAPHPPFGVEEPWFSMHDRSAVPAPVTGPRSGQPRYVELIQKHWQTGALDDDGWAELVATYYGMVARVDDQLGRVLAAVDRAGAAERTVTAFFTDHGEYLGDFGLVEKWPSGLHDCLLRNPLVIAGPGISEGARVDTLVEMVDLFATALDLAQVEARHTHFGQSLRALLAGDAIAHRRAAFSEGGFALGEEPLLERSPEGSFYFAKGQLQHDDTAAVGKAVSVRTAEWTYVHRLYEGHELYDRVADPRELHNLAGEPHLASVEITLRAQVLEWLLSTSDVIPWVPDPRF